MDNSIWSNLPPEMVAHVLSHLPVKSLCRFQCVSPSWNSLISSPHFSKTHLHVTNTTNKPQKTLLISSSHALYSVDYAAANPTAKRLDFPSVQPSDKWVRSLGSFNGLVLISDGNSNFLLNPYTGYRKELPKLPFLDVSSIRESCIFLRGLDYDSYTDDYKVVMIPSHYLESDIDSSFTQGVTLMSVHIGFVRGPVDGFETLVAFDFWDEIFKEVQLHASSDYDHYSYLY